MASGRSLDFQQPARVTLAEVLPRARNHRAASFELRGFFLTRPS